MLRIQSVSKTYVTGDLTQRALDDVSLNLRDNEFVAILGPSGSGKTTLLNIIGGLDRYDSGDLIINGVSTKGYGDRDWDSYRNHTIGFVFQSYNLIPHQSVLANVELALTISGVSREERRQRAVEALESVGLGDQLHKRPAQMSGGQMQRVAIARALVNNPDIVLADEPTGALDSETSIAIMNLLKEVAQDRLVVMVTHNPELAQEYATRIVNLKDGHIVGDTDPLPLSGDEPEPEHSDMGRVSMSFLTALPLSFNNLRTKKGRTLLTAFAGSIGIIGIALILSLSNGVNNYIDDIERDTMGNYPIELEKEAINLDSMMANGGLEEEVSESHELDKIYSNNIVGDAVSATKDMTSENNLGAFKTHYEANKEQLGDAVSAVEYEYGIVPQVFRLTEDGADQASPASIESRNSRGVMSMFSSSTDSAWVQLPRSEQLQQANYELLSGSWPVGANEVALVISEDNEVSDFVLYTLGLMDEEHMDAVIEAAENGEEIDDPQQSFSYDDALGLEFKVLAPCQLYYEESGVWVDGSDDDDFVAERAVDGMTVTITAVLRAGEDADVTSGVVYAAALTDELMSLTAESDVVKAQLSDPSVNVLTGKAFDDDDDDSSESSSSTSQVAYRSNPSAANTETAGVTLAEGSAATTSAVYRIDSDTSLSASSDSRGLAALASGDPESAEGDESGESLFAVTFKNYDGSVLLAAREYAAGTEIDSLPKTTPQRPADASYEYAFIGWKSSATNGVYATADLPAVTETVEYTAYYYAKTITPSGGNGGTTIPDTNITGSMTDLSAFTASSATGLTDAQLAVMMAQSSDATPSTYEDVMDALGYAVSSEPSTIKIYPSDFEGKQVIEDFITAYNDQAPEADKVTYTDMVGLMVSSITSIVNMISYVLIAFVAVSLIVSCIMIGIITYISVLERTKEIGILRAMGASKRNISQVFNAETFIVGLFSGLIGIGATLLLLIPVNAIIHAVTGVTSVTAALPVLSAFALIALSVLLTLAGGLIPAKSAAKKDPVVALRTE